MAEGKGFLERLREFKELGVAIVFIIGCSILAILKFFLEYLTWTDIILLFIIWVLSLLLSWVVFFFFNVGYFRMFGKEFDQRIQALISIKDAFLKKEDKERGIVPEFKDGIVPDMQTTSKEIGVTSDNLAKLLEVEELIKRFVLFQGAKDYKEALLKVPRGTSITDMRFMGTLIGARKLLLSPIIGHLQNNKELRTLKIIASKIEINGSDLRYFAINFSASLAKQIFENPKLKELRDDLSKRGESLTIYIKYLETDIFASIFIIDDQRLILAPTHGINDGKQVRNFNIGVIVPNEQTIGERIFQGNKIIERQTEIFDERFGKTKNADEVWIIHGSTITINKATWNYNEVTKKFDLNTPSSGKFDLTLDQVKSLEQESGKDLFDPYQDSYGEENNHQ